jgi:sugar lactone lactonase YvrE
VDIRGKRIHAWKDGHDESILLDETIGCIAPRRDGGLVAALRASIVTIDWGVLRNGIPQSSNPAGYHPAPQLLARVPDPATNRFNDGKCDPAGRFLAGTMDDAEQVTSGNFYSFETGKPPRRLFNGIRIANGLAWSPDHKTFYYIDTATRQVRAYEYDVDSGNISNPRIAVEVPESMGWPDGMTSDMEGKLWIALWGGAKVARWNPLNGQLEAEVAVPALQTSSCVFYVTSARVGMDESALAKYPLSGGLFQIQTQIQGMPTFTFA